MKLDWRWTLAVLVVVAAAASVLVWPDDAATIIGKARSLAEVMQVLTAALTWPIVVLALGILMHKPVGKLIERSADIKLKIGEYEVILGRGEAKRMLEELFRDVESLLKSVSVAERRRIIGVLENRDAKIEEFYPGFSRKDEELESLRTLRDAQLLTPKGSGKFRDGSTILQLKPFGRIMLKYRRDFILGSEGPSA